MRWSLILALMALPLSAQAAGKVASAGICADQVVLALVDRDRIVGVSPEAALPAVSPVAEEARGLPVLHASAEQLVLAGADIVVLDTYGEGKTRALLEKLGVRVLRAPYDATLADVPVSLRRLGADLGESARAEALAQDFRRRLDALAADRPPMLTAAYYRPDGGSAGAGTYVAEAMALAGYYSLAAKLGQVGWGRLDLEVLALNPPEAVVTSFFDGDRTSLRRMFGRHPVFRQQLASTPVVSVPGQLWGCGGWPVAAAARYMADHHPRKAAP